MNIKRITAAILAIALGVVLIGKISNWFLNYSDQTTAMLNTAMFSLLGIIYIRRALPYKNWVQFLLITCGIYLIIMNFMERTTFISIIGILCIASPMLLARFYKGDKHKEQLIEEI